MRNSGMVGLFGGTFDPIHVGHLRTALELHQSLQLDEMRLVPCASPYHRQQPALAVKHRLAMLRLALGNNSYLSIDERELSRTGPSYTVDTLTEVRHELGENRPLLLCIGIDTLAQISTWHRWEAILGLAHIVAVGRPGFTLPTTGPVAEMLQQKKVADKTALQQSPCGALLIQQMTLLPISATQIRASVQQGSPITYLVPEAVEHYIANQGLYQHQEGAK